MSEPVELNTQELRASIDRILASVGESDSKLIDEVRRLQEADDVTPERRRMYEQAIDALEKSRRQRMVPVRRKIAEAMVRLAAELELPLAVSDRPARRRQRRRDSTKQRIDQPS